MTFTQSVVFVWTITKTTLSETCQLALQEKITEMVTAGQTDGQNYLYSPRMSEYRFTDQDAAEEFAGYLTLTFPCNTDIESVAINSI
jgi:hypothetical protein